MPPIQRYIGLLFGGLAAMFLLLALQQRFGANGHAIQVRAFIRIGFIFAAVSLLLLISGR